MLFLPGIQSFKNKLEKAIEFLWLGTIFVVPLIFIPNIFTTFELAKVVFFRGLVLIMMLLSILKYFVTAQSPQVRSLKENNYPISFIFLGAFSVFFFLSTLFSFAPALSFLGWYPRFQGLYTSMFYFIFGTIVFYRRAGFCIRSYHDQKFCKSNPLALL